VNLTEVLGIDKYAPLSVVYFVNQVDQDPGRAAVQVSPGSKEQIAIALSVWDTEILTHIEPPSASLYLKPPFSDELLDLNSRF
jgi:hypothetical protein